ncbi:sulfurtransferase complex subunit TusC [Candidatus Schneideria nysicola]|uniref:sulfurtransferase complex subunit TusC n=1 Tax=Candidatus Schneideria nysicola TaxID=1081631 RepID=UPI001CAA803C|nr:sulfurtransferase complex subunit TusC [Candidatus Schneideria nysicola]UAJ66084.1 sulfurtransferase complex subunit TusC [Candidatus Schneideria nysicola]
MNSIAFVFNQGSYGNASSREGMDVLLAVSSIYDKIGIFFISDGILLLVPNQNPQNILLYNFIKAFNLLPIYGIKNIYLCKNSLIKYGLNHHNIKWILNAEKISANVWRKKIDKYDKIFCF